jgi:hypothetical protein
MKRHLVLMMNDGVFSRRTGAGRMNEHVLQFVASVADRWTRVTLLATTVPRDSPASRLSRFSAVGRCDTRGELGVRDLGVR